MFRAGLGAALVLLGALGAAAAGALPANAIPAGGTPDGFTVVIVNDASVPDQMTTVVESASTITGLTASLMSGTDDEYDAAMTLVSSDSVDATYTRTTWQATIPEGTPPSGLAPGTYTDKLTATYSDSGTSSVTPGTFGFLIQPTVTLAASNTSLTYGSVSTALSGTVTLADPDGTPVTDYAGMSVNIIASEKLAETLPLSSAGTFSDPDFTPAENTVVVAQVGGTATMNIGQSAAVYISIVPGTPTLALKVNHVTETYGHPVTVTGRLSYTSGSTSLPLAGREIWIGNHSNGTSPLVTGTTGSGGSFSITLPLQKAATRFYVGSTSQAYLKAVDTPLTLNVVNPTVISGFKVSLDQYWDLSVSGCLGLKSGNKTQRFTSTSGLTVQYASSANGPWKKLGSISGTEPDFVCGTGGINFTGSFTAPYNTAYYRVVYAGTSGSTSLASTTSPSVLAWRYYDRITGLKVSPTVVSAGGKLTISGTLQYYYSGWHNYSGQIIYIVYNPKGSKQWYWLVKVKTNSKGHFSATFKDPVSATWQAAFFGNNNNGVGHLSAGSAEVYVRLK